MHPEPSPDQALLRRTASALIWSGAFCFSLTVFLVLLKRLDWLPPTPPIAVGKVTVEGASKLRDYVAAALFYSLVPVFTVGFGIAGRSMLRWILEPLRSPGRPQHGFLFLTALFTAPFLFSPLFYLTTRKEGWGLILPVALGWGMVEAVVRCRSTPWLRLLMGRESWPVHGLLLGEGLAWVVFRYLAAGRRIGHIPTLFLEVVLVAFFLSLFWGACVLAARLAALLRGESVASVLPRVATGCTPLLSLPFFGLLLFPARPVVAIVVAISIVSIVGAISLRISFSSRNTRRILVWIFIPGLIFILNFASIASPDQWTDLFHRGESLGPASDYLRGKVPFRDVFVLHGMLDDGFLDAGLMQLFGRSAQVASWRVMILESMELTALWLLALTLFESAPLAILTLALAFVTSPGNQRVILEVLSLTALLGGLRHRRLSLFALSGLFASFALFYSLETGIYALAGGAITIGAVWACGRLRRTAGQTLEAGRTATAWLGGTAAGAIPFAAFLAMNGALTQFVSDSFVTIPSIIDAIWSLPYPDLASPFRGDLSLRAVSEFLLGESIRFVLTPLVLVAGAAYLLVRLVGRRVGGRDELILALVVFGILTERSAIGRADFQHQIFAAFLTGPLLVALLVELARTIEPIRLRGSSPARLFLAAVAVVAALAATVVLWVPDLLGARIDGLVEYRLRMSVFGYHDPKALEVADRVEAIRIAIDGALRPDEPMFDFSNQPALYFFANRPNPTRFYQIPILSPPRFQSEAIAALERARPGIVIRRSAAIYDKFDGISNDLRAPALAAYINGTYLYARSVRGIELWTRKERSAAAKAVFHSKEVPIPSRDDLAAVNDRRVMFPSVASIAGAAGSQWVSDLLLYNPSSISSMVELRYLSGDRVIRRVLLQPGERRLWSDLVSTLFGRPGSRGSLVIDSPRHVNLIALASTYDSSRHGVAPTEHPFTEEDSASAGGNSSTLLIAGIPGGDRTRVSVGVASFGQEPLKVRISVPAADGGVGRSVEAIADEEGSYVLSDARTALGTTIDRTTVVRIDVLKGRVIGWASAVDTETGDATMIPAVPR